MPNNFFRFTSDAVYHVKTETGLNPLLRVKRLITIIINRCLFAFRWKIVVRNEDILKKHPFNPKYGILFVSNHSSHMDGNMIYYGLSHCNHFLQVWAHDFVFKLPYLGWALSNVGHVKVPNIYGARNHKHKKQVHKAILRTVDGLKQGKHFLIFPSGHSKKTAHEKINGKSAFHQILTMLPDANIVFITHSGMWGSRFSSIYKKPEKCKTEAQKWINIILDYAKMACGNLIFFVPKRQFTMKLEAAPDDLPRFATRKELNLWLEKYFNKDLPEEGEHVTKIKDYFWSNKGIEHVYRTKEYIFDTSDIPEDMRHDIINFLRLKTGIKEIEESHSLNRDLCLDSLEITDIFIELEKKYHHSPIPIGTITTVGHLMSELAKKPVDIRIKEFELTFEEPKPRRLLKLKEYINMRLFVIFFLLQM